jgi:hypothetical protein
MKFLSRLSLLILIFALAACDVIRAFAPVVLPPPTALPTNTPYPTPTPQPGVVVQVKIRAPANTPSGSSIVMNIPDRVGGLANKTYILTNSGNNTWTTTFNATIGSLIRYRFQRISGGQAAGEVLANGSLAGDRITLISGSLILEDTINGWADTPFIGDKGRISGIIKDASSNQGVAGLIVMASGQQTTTGFDGEYNFYNVLANAPTPVTVFAPEGSFRAQTKNATAPKDGVTQLNFSVNAARAVKVSFIVALPIDSVKSAPVKLAANILQMGDTFNSNPVGSTIAVPRMISLAPLPDGRWAATLSLYEGIDLRYKYTLGGPHINAELGASGEPIARQIVLGPDDVIIQDQVVTWKRSIDAPVNFSLGVPDSTPSADTVTMQFKIGGVWFEPVMMWRASQNSWSYTLFNPVDFNGQAEYRFCRNYQCDTAGDSQTVSYRFTPTVLPQVLQNTITKWQWLGAQTPVNTSLPAITPRPGFQTGVELAPYTTPEQPALPPAFDQIKDLSADWIRIPIIWDAPSINPPVIAPDSRAPIRSDLIAAIRAARERGLKVALYPQVLPAKNDLNTFFESGKKDAEWWNNFHREYARFIAYYADVAAFTGADMIYITDSSLARAFKGGCGAPQDADDRWRNLIKAIRKDHFNAALAFAVEFTGKTPALTATPPAFTDQLDVIDVRFSAALSNLPTATSDELKKNAESLIDTHLKPLSTQFKKPILLTAIYTSADGAATYCIGAATGSCQPFANAAPDKPDNGLYPLDLNEQAMVYEALLNAINSRTWINGFYGYGYYVPVAIRDKYYSPRSKPAEVIMASWFARLK